MRFFNKLAFGAAFLAAGLAGGILANFLGGINVVASNAPGILQAQQFQLVDQNGVVKGGFATTSEGFASFFLLNKNGARVVEIIASDKKTKLNITTPSSSPAIRLESSNISPSLSLFYPNGKEGVFLNMEKGMVPVIGLFGEDNRSRLVLTQNSPNGLSGIVIQHNSKALCYLGTQYSEGSALHLTDYTTGKTARVMASRKETLIGIKDNRGKRDFYSGLSLGPEGTELLLKSSSNSKLQASTSSDGTPRLEMVKDGVTVWSKP